MKSPPVIALLTDFGTMDAYVASMRGVILSIAPNATIIDISHSIEPQNIDEAAYIIWTTFRYFPKNTTFICVVDPGVGSNRNIICVESKDYRFIAPDNGLLKYILGSLHRPKVIAVKNKNYFLPQVSTTFHGRDVFAPIAAQLAKGLSSSKLGPETTPLFHAEQFKEVNLKYNDEYNGSIIHIDYFGNIITNFLIKGDQKKTFKLKIGTGYITKLFSSYADAPTKKPFLIIGSSGLLEIVVKNGNASNYVKAPVKSNLKLTISNG
ncbi:MAG: SAM-dependent chlorinase/fluorinase [Ignavibacteriales bacterium]|nr:SAM-dependent chlorinase/fluorinase [Ignavibacteriales bacterium]